jgi:acetoacetyl-CoA synthetase
MDNQFSCENSMDKPLWQPHPTTAKESHMARFIAYINEPPQCAIENYFQLHQWSITYPEKFWPAVWAFTGIKASHKGEKVLTNPHDMLKAKWFTGAQLNFAENLLQRRDDEIALIFRNEKGLRRTLTYAQLYTQVMQLASAMRAMGIKPHDRVAGFLPNLPETIIAMLATTSLGAIWSSCSPDFGISGVLDRFGQITPKLLFTVDGYHYNGHYYDLLEKTKALLQQIPSIEKCVVVPYGQTTPDIHPLRASTLLADFLDPTADKLHFTPFPFDHPIYILYSSGTTGVPKCIVHSAGGTLLQHLKELMLHTNLKTTDTIFYYTTCGWMMWNWFVSSLAVGAKLVLYDGSPVYPKPNRLFSLIDEEKISIFGTSANYISAIKKVGLTPISGHKLHSLHTILSTGSPLLPENFDFVYLKIKHDVCLSSISGGTDIVSCFALGNPLLPVYRGELQCLGLGMNVAVFNEEAQPVIGEKGELVCLAPFPSMPVSFWNDPRKTKYRKAYFARYPKIWAHGDYAKITTHGGMIIYGRSDATLKPGGVRIGTAEIYRVVEKIPEILECAAIAQEWRNDMRIILFVKLRPHTTLTDPMKLHIKALIREQASPHHVPTKIIQIADIPHTLNGKMAELAIREIIHGHPVKNKEALANPEALDYFAHLKELEEN